MFRGFICLFCLPSCALPLLLTALQTCRRLTWAHKRHTSLVWLYLYYAKKIDAVMPHGDERACLRAAQRYPGAAEHSDFRVINAESH